MADLRDSTKLPELCTSRDMEAVYKFVILRHGESEYTQKNLFCGFAHDADLTDVGVQEAIRAGQVRTLEGACACLSLCVHVCLCVTVCIPVYVHVSVYTCVPVCIHGCVLVSSVLC